MHPRPPPSPYPPEQLCCFLFFVRLSQVVGIVIVIDFVAPSYYRYTPSDLCRASPPPCHYLCHGRDEGSFYAMVKLFLAIPIESQCCQSYGVCGAQFATDVIFDE